MTMCTLRRTSTAPQPRARLTFGIKPAGKSADLARMRFGLLPLCLALACQFRCPPVDCNENVDIMVPMSTFLTAPETDTVFTVHISNGASTTICTVELSGGTLISRACNDRASEVSLVDDQVQFRYAREPKRVQVRIMNGSTVVDEGTFKVEYEGDRCCQSGEVTM